MTHLAGTSLRGRGTATHPASLRSAPPDPASGAAPLPLCTVLGRADHPLPPARTPHVPADTPIQRRQKATK